jgi:succinate dehydrogenase/fumarate reductase flavoprotein subunit
MLVTSADGAAGADLQEVCCDVLVIGSGATGARAALEAAEQGTDVLIATKGLVARSGATVTADGEFAVDGSSARTMFGVDGSPDDSPEQFARDMILGGDYLADQQLVAIHTEEAPACIRQLFDWGARVEGFSHAPGHTHARNVWFPGRKLARLLARRLRASGIRVLENVMVVDLVRDGEGVVGAVALDLQTGGLLLLRSRAVILATGGATRVFPLTTAPEELTGDGLAMALRCGAALQDMEFPMFLPYTFLSPPALRGLIFPHNVICLLEAHALNRQGERYMAGWDPQHLERTTRDINSVASDLEVRAGRGSPAGGTYLSFKHLPSNLLEFAAEWFPADLRGWRGGGFRLRDFFPDLEQAWEVAPACHFWNGGIKIDERCETGIPGLFAAGEGTAGIHGANRLAGNALTMTQVWGRRAGAFAGAYARSSRLREPSGTEVEDAAQKVLRLRSPSSGPSVVEVRKQIRHIAGDLVGIVREEASLLRALEAILDLRDQLPRQRAQGTDPRFNREWVEGLQNESLLDVLEAVVRASLGRTESRGAMYRLDYPLTDDDRWLCNIILERQNGEWTLREQPVRQLYVALPRGRRAYGQKGEERHAST